MKARTIFQKQIMEDQKLLPKSTQDQKKYALKHCHSKYVALAYTKDHYCLECGFKWKASVSEMRKKKSCSCPACKQKLIEFKDYKPHSRTMNYLTVVDIANGKQVVRFFASTKLLNKGNKAEHIFLEVMQHWITEDAKTHILSMPRKMFSTYLDDWCLTGNIEFRTSSYSYDRLLYTFSAKTYPKFKVLPMLKRNGIKSSFQGLRPTLLIQALMKDSYIESLFKLKQYGLVEEYLKGQKIKESHKPSIKIAIRNNYIVKDASDWFDYLDMLEKFGKDIRNAYYVCPSNLKLAHDTYVKKVKARKKRELFDLETQAKNEEIAERKAELLNDNAKYIQEKQKFFDLTFKHKNITLSPLKSVQEFYEDGEDLNHCIFSSGYYERENSLLFSAKKRGKTIETVEVSLKNFSILQARGINNKPSELNKEVISLMNKNIPSIIERAQAS